MIRRATTKKVVKKVAKGAKKITPGKKGSFKEIANRALYQFLDTHSMGPKQYAQITREYANMQKKPDFHQMDFDTRAKTLAAKTGLLEETAQDFVRLKAFHKDV